jgi:hypothetical protein
MQKYNKSKSNKKHNYQKIYKMRGCSSNCTRKHRHRHRDIHGRSYLGGSNSTVIATPSKVIGADFNLAYPYNGPVIRNTALAYTGKGGYKSDNALFPEPSNLAVTTSNVNGANPLYPNTGPQLNGGFNFLNPLNQQRGGCGCGLPFMNGGASKRKHGNKNHRVGCRCSTCKMTLMKGGGGCQASNNGILYPNGLVGSPYVNSSNLPGANGIPGDANYYSNNTYNNDVSRQMINVGANPPFLGLKGGAKKKYTLKSRKQRGGTMTNYFGQDLINLGRQIGHGVGSAFNALNGYPASPNPLPWKDQLVSKH